MVLMMARFMIHFKSLDSSRIDTPIDRGVFVNMEGFYLQEGHAKPIESTDVSEQTKLNNDESPGEGLLPFNQREGPPFC